MSSKIRLREKYSNRKMILIAVIRDNEETVGFLIKAKTFIYIHIKYYISSVAIMSILK